LSSCEAVAANANVPVGTRRVVGPGCRIYPTTMLTILVVSDATGETAERMVRSALVQFETRETNVIRRGQIRTRGQVRAIVKEAAACRAIVVHTLVSDDLRDLMLAQSRLHGVDSMDLMGPVLDRLAHHLRLTPKEKPGLFRQLIDAKSRAIEAVEFAFRHDDGMRSGELDRAEAVIVGVSRTMKTPTMLYLAYHGWFVANVPIVPELELPAKLFAFPAERVFCLEMTPTRLLELREARAESTRVPPEPYASLPHVRRELLYAQHLCAKYGWRAIDVTGKSVEEVAREITVLLSDTSGDGGRRD
jgi:[pyruvate, water dikinase]-phosphate phosphotransferase / [pyruvate, water dikinase] kinase